MTPLKGVTIYMYVDIFKVPNCANRHLIFMKPNYKWGSACSQTKIFTYNIYITVYTIYIRGKVSMYIIHLCVYMRCKLCDRLSACALHLAQLVKFIIRFSAAYIKESS